VSASASSFPAATAATTPVATRRPAAASIRAGTASPPPQQPKLLDRLREALRSRHYSPRTEQCYRHWVKRFIFFHHVRHPAEMAEPEINAFLLECLRLRVQDIDIAAGQIMVRDGKGFKDRRTIRPRPSRAGIMSSAAL